MKISASRVNSFEQCQRKYYYQYVNIMPKDADYIEPDYFSYGNIMHRILEEINKNKRISFVECWQIATAPVSKKPGDFGYDGDVACLAFINSQEDETFKAKMEAVYSVYVAFLNNNPDISIVSTEMRLDTETATIIIDVMYKIANKFYIVDFKSSSASLRGWSDVTTMNLDPQLALYAAHAELIRKSVQGLKNLEFGGVMFIHFAKKSTTKISQADKKQAEKTGRSAYDIFLERYCEDSSDLMRIALVEAEHIKIKEAMQNYELQKEAILKLHDGKSYGTQNLKNCSALMGNCPYFSQCHNKLASEKGNIIISQGDANITDFLVCPF